MPQSSPSTWPKEGVPGWAAVIALSLLPLVVWSSQPSGPRFAGFTTHLTSLGQITGLLGMSLFSIALVLSARIRLFDEYFGGLDRAYRAHRLVGGTAFVLLLFHPVLLSLRYVPSSLNAAALFLLPGSDMANDFGIAALLLLMLCLLITFFLRFPYQRWKLSHKFLGPAFFFAGLHSLLVASDVSRIPLLRAYMLSLAGVGLAAFAYRALFARFFVKYFEYSVEKATPLSGDIVELELSPKGEKLSFTPGQFVFISIVSGSLPIESHPFSISSSSAEANLRLSVKSLGDYTSRLKGVKPGSLAKIEGPFGRLSSALSDRPQVWIAGGIGITPFLSMSRSLKDARSIDLYYCVRNGGEAVFLKELRAISARLSGFRVLPFFSEEDGRITADAIRKSSGDLRNKEFFICGPPMMMKDLKSQLLSSGVPGKGIHSEEFQLL